MAKKFDFYLVEIVKKLSSKKDDKGKLMVKETRLKTIKKKSEPYKQIYFKNKYSESFANWYYENHLLGYTCGRTLKDIFLEKRTGLFTLREVEDADVDENVSFVGSIEGKPYFGKSRNDNQYMKVFVKDETANIKVMIFSKRLESMLSENADNPPEENNIIIVSGKKKDEVVFADRIAIQTNKIYTKLSDLKDA
jgi:hypothetical protein